MDELFNRLNIKPNDLKLYNIAFSHSSYANEHKAKSDYERLEFLGDAIVDMVVAEYFYRNYSEDEGQMTKERASYVCENALYEYSIDLGLAMYLDLGFATTRRFILDTVVPYIENPDINFFNDYKSSLQEYVQAEQDTIETQNLCITFGKRVADQLKIQMVCEVKPKQENI